MVPKIQLATYLIEIEIAHHHSRIIKAFYTHTRKEKSRKGAQKAIFFLL